MAARIFRFGRVPYDYRDIRRARMDLQMIMEY